MRNYGKIVICADSIEEAEKELNMIKDLINLGAESGSGSAKSGTAEATLGPRVEMIKAYPNALPNDLMTRAMANAYAENCPCCDEVFSSDYLDKPVEMDGRMMSRFIAEVMGL